MAVSITDVAYLNDFYIMAEKMGGGIKLSANSKALFSERKSVSPHPINKKDECDKKKKWCNSGIFNHSDIKIQTV